MSDTGQRNRFPFSILSSQLSILAAVAAGLCWSGALALLIFGGLSVAEPPLAPQRLLYYGLVLGAALLTFAPIERSLGIAGLTVEGLVGVALLLYGLAFVPPPTEWLLSPPDMPVYALLIGAIFLCGAAGSRPFLAVIGRRLFTQRVRALDMRRVRRRVLRGRPAARCPGGPRRPARPHMGQRAAPGLRPHHRRAALPRPLPGRT